MLERAGGQRLLAAAFILGVAGSHPGLASPVPGGNAPQPAQLGTVMVGLPAGRLLDGSPAQAVALVCRKNSAGKWVWHNCQIVGGQQVCQATTTACTPP
jgi:hypothetical protein